MKLRDLIRLWWVPAAVVVLALVVDQGAGLRGGVPPAAVLPSPVPPPEMGGQWTAPLPPRPGAVATMVPLYPTPEELVRHYFGPLGAADVAIALAVGDCETGGSWDAGAVGAQGELGLFQLHPEGVARRYLDLGWNLLDARENVVAAALYVARNGWSSWSACLP